MFNSENSQRLTIKPIKPTEIKAQDTYTANAEVTAKANGIVPVTAQLMTESGRPVGRPFDIEVQVTQNGTTGWAIAVAAGDRPRRHHIPPDSPGGQGTDHALEWQTARAVRRARALPPTSFPR